VLSQAWHIRLLGRVEARQGETVVSRFATRQAARLFVYLAGNVGKNASRESLIEMLWPDVDLETGRNRLRVALASIRRLIELPGTRPGSVLVADRTHLRLSDDACRVDAHEFRRSVNRAMAEPSQQRAAELLIQADELYGGAFCEGLDEDDWILDERYSLTHLQVTGQIRLSEILALSGDAERAVKYARRAVLADPLSEPARRVMIRMLLARDQADAATLELREFERVLRRETGLSPSPETVRLLDSNRRVAVADRVAPVAAPRPAVAIATAPITEIAAPADDRLPHFLDRFVERLDELSSLESLINVSRIVSLTGPGGIGKTRLAVELMRSATASFGSGMWFVPVPQDRPGHLLDLVVQALNLGQSNAPDPLALIASILGMAAPESMRPASLLVIDGAEHLPDTAGKEILALLRAAPNLTLVITSRRRLGLVGEQEHEVRPLEVVDLQSSPSLKEVAGNPSVRLFVDRAQAVQPDFQLTGTNAPHLLQICRALDGIPLAIELAAARIRRVPLRAMAEDLEQLKAAEESRSWRPSRQRSLHSTIAWSFDALLQEDQNGLTALSVFPRSCDPEAAEAVLSASDPRPVLDRLVESFLVIRENGSRDVRYRMLNSVRDFAAARLNEEEARALERKHAEHYMYRAMRFAASIPSGVFGHNMLVNERENFRAALDWYSSKPELATFVASLTWLWVFHGGLTEGRHWVQYARARIDPNDKAALAQLDLSEGILACYRDEGDEAIHHIAAASELFEELGDSHGLNQTLWATGYAEFVRGNFPAAREVMTRSLAGTNPVGTGWWMAACHNLLGFTEYGENNLDQAESHFHASKEIWERIGERMVTSHSDLGLAKVAWSKGKLSEAEQLYKSTLQRFVQREDYRGITYSVEGLARVSVSFERFSLAARLLGAAQRLRETHHLHLDATDSRLHDEAVEVVKAKLTRRFDAEWSIGYGLNPDAIPRYAANAT